MRLKGFRIAATLVMVLLVSSVASATALAGPVRDGAAAAPLDAPMPTLITPNTYSNCPTSVTHDMIRVTGVAPTQTVNGRVNVQFVTDTGRISIQNSVTYLGQTHDSPFTVVD